VKSDGPDDLVFRSVKSGCPMRDNNILARHIQLARKETGNRLGQLAGAQAVLRHLAKDGGDRSSRQAISHAAFPIHDYGGDLRTGSNRSRNFGLSKSSVRW
jgi:hypothetical protein